MRGGLFLRGNRARLEQRVRLGKLCVEFGLRCAERVDLRAQCLGPSFEIFGGFRRVLEDFGRFTGGARLRRADAHEGIEFALRFVSAGRLPCRLREALKPLRLAIGRSARRIGRLRCLGERVLAGFADFIERALDIILPGDADADRDVAVTQGTGSLR